MGETWGKCLYTPFYVYQVHMRIATAICRWYERRPTDVSEVLRKMMWMGYRKA